MVSVPTPYIEASVSYHHIIYTSNFNCHRNAYKANVLLPFVTIQYNTNVLEGEDFGELQDSPKFSCPKVSFLKAEVFGIYS